MAEIIVYFWKQSGDLVGDEFDQYESMAAMATYQSYSQGYRVRAIGTGMCSLSY